MTIFKNILETIGNTPIVKINSLNKGNSNIFAKIEYFNPAGSIKDRVAYAMINDAIKEGKINKNTTLIEATSGNTGIGLALVCAVMGLKLILLMPENMSKERRDALKAYGANLVLTPASLGMKGAVDRANDLNKEIENSYILKQFDNPSNPNIHFATTANEIYNDFNGNVDILVAGVGTGGTISGISKKLKSLNPDIKAYAVEPLNSPLLTKGCAGSHKIQGIGANFIPSNLDRSVIDGIIDIDCNDAINCARNLAKIEGIFCGISSGAAMHAALELSKKSDNKDKNIVVILPDTGMRYMSGPLFEQ